MPGSRREIVAVTMGDAAGIGPELCLHLLSKKELPGDVIPLIIGDYDVLARVAKKLNVPFEVPRLDAAPMIMHKPAVFDPPGSLAGEAVEPGKDQAICGRAAARYIEEAAVGCVRGLYAAMVTAPISKKSLELAKIDYPGHTEMLGELTGAPKSAMLLYSDKIACAFTTSHVALGEVPKSLTTRKIVEVAEQAHKFMSAIRGGTPRLALLGLNPHAGEQGLFGDEEQRIIAPARKTLMSRQIDVEGPLPADTAFTPDALKRFDCHIAMYHDQGGIPFKMLSFDTGVNVTMGLPIIRTSPDHGTAFDIAWQGKARTQSFMNAFELAVKLAKQQRKGTVVCSPPTRMVKPFGASPPTKTVKPFGAGR